MKDNKELAGLSSLEGMSDNTFKEILLPYLKLEDLGPMVVSKKMRATLKEFLPDLIKKFFELLDYGISGMPLTNFNKSLLLIMLQKVKANEFDNDKTWKIGKVGHAFLKKAAREGDLTSVKQLSARIYIDQEILQEAVLSGNHTLVSWLLEPGNALPPIGFHLDIDELVRFNDSYRIEWKKDSNQKTSAAEVKSNAVDQIEHKSRQPEERKEEPLASPVKARKEAIEKPIALLERVKRRYDALLAIFGLGFFVLSAMNMAVVWPMLMIAGGCGVMAIRKAHFTKTKTPFAALGFYGVGLTLALVLPSYVSGISYFSSLAFLIGAMMVFGLAWFISICRAHTHERNTDIRTCAVLALLVGTILLTAGTGPYWAFASYLPTAVASAIFLAVAMAPVAIMFCCMCCIISNAQHREKFSVANSSNIPDYHWIRIDWLQQQQPQTQTQPNPQTVLSQGQDSAIEMSAPIPIPIPPDRALSAAAVAAPSSDGGRTFFQPDQKYSQLPENDSLPSNQNGM